MTTQEMARSFLRRAAAILREAERLLGDEAWNLVVRRCQEAVEFALKGALREAGVEVPKVHDVSGALRRNTRRLPAHLAAEIDLLVSASRRLREERELAFLWRRGDRGRSALLPGRRGRRFADNTPGGGAVHGRASGRQTPELTKASLG